MGWMHPTRSASICCCVSWTARRTRAGSGRTRSSGYRSRAPTRPPPRTTCRCTGISVGSEHGSCPSRSSTSSTAGSTPRIRPTSKSSWWRRSAWRRTARPCGLAPRSSRPCAASSMTAVMPRARATRVVSRRRCRRTRPPSRSSCAPSSGRATDPARTSRSRWTRRRAPSWSRGPVSRASPASTGLSARAGRSIRASSSTCGNGGSRRTRSSRSRTGSAKRTGPAGAS